MAQLVSRPVVVEELVEMKDAVCADLVEMQGLVDGAELADHPNQLKKKWKDHIKDLKGMCETTEKMREIKARKKATVVR